MSDGINWDLLEQDFLRGGVPAAEFWDLVERGVLFCQPGSSREIRGRHFVQTAFLAPLPGTDAGKVAGSAELAFALAEAIDDSLDSLLAA